jgi:hypothetical protein
MRRNNDSIIKNRLHLIIIRARMRTIFLLYQKLLVILRVFWCKF